MHPADIDPADHRITLAELTAYAAAWKKNEAWPIGPNPIPLNYVTRAGELWKNGEDYVFDPQAGPAPLWWVNKKGPGVQSVTENGIGASTELRAANSVKRFIGAKSPVGDELEIELLVTPSPFAAAYAVEESIPTGWAISEISSDGVFDESSRTIRWGVFHEPATRSLFYHLNNPPALNNNAVFSGRAAFDGQEVGVAGGDNFVANFAPPSCLMLVGDGECLISFPAETGRSFLVQASADLRHWSDVGVFVARDGLIQLRDSMASHMSQCFYRAVPQD
ncbi:MAG: hypothetical protein HY043_09885 [Verrucomicrobia bacterium]|nr:hypothetical protein [Verrucomicrobiota bacterium]